MEHRLCLVTVQDQSLQESCELCAGVARSARKEGTLLNGYEPQFWSQTVLGTNPSFAWDQPWTSAVYVPFSSSAEGQTSHLIVLRLKQEINVHKTTESSQHILANHGLSELQEK